MPQLAVNVDHIATIRQARGGAEPDPVLAAGICELAGAKGIVVEDHERIAIHQESISACGNQNWHGNFHILLVKILVLPAQIQHTLFVRTEAVKRFPLDPFEFQLGMVSLAVNHLFECASDGF